MSVVLCWCCGIFFFFQAEDGIRDLVRSRGLGDVYKRQVGGRALGLVVQQGDHLFARTVEEEEILVPVTIKVLSLIHI